MFGHAYKGQPSGRVLLDRFKSGGGTLYDGLALLVLPSHFIASQHNAPIG